jgi:hypothetical protein
MQLFAWHIIESYKKLDGGNFSPPECGGSVRKLFQLQIMPQTLAESFPSDSTYFSFFLPVFQYFIEKNGNF